MSDKCLFCEIVKGAVSSHTVWQDDEHQAFLTPFPNTRGFTVVIPRAHHPSYGFAVPEPVLTRLVSAARTVGLQIDRNLGVKRTGMIMEGFGIDHLHIKLVPMHGINQGTWKAINSTVRTFYDSYTGMIASHDGPRMLDAELDAIARRIRGEW